MAISMRAAEYIARELAKRGIRHVFGIPGGPSIPYLEAFGRHGIDFILTSSETAAGVMADVTGRITRRPGICHSTFGPGATNLATGVGGALLDRSPVLAFTSEMPDSMIARTCQMNIDHQSLFRPLVKNTWRMSPENVVQVMEQGFKAALFEYPGPVHIGIPADLAEKEVEGVPSPPDVPGDQGLDFEIKSLRKLLRKAANPVVALGLTARRQGAGPQVQRLLCQHPMPVFLTPMAKGVIPESHPCYAGVLFHALSSKLTPAYDEADLVIGLGYDPVEYNFESWMPDVPLVSVNTIPIDMPEGMECSQVTGDLAEGINLVFGLLAEKRQEIPPAVSGVREEMASVFSSLLFRFGPVTVLDVLKNELPDEAFVTIDVGSHLHVTGQYWDPPSPDQLIMTNGWSSVGFGLPAALAVQLQNPGKPVVCITGDGGLLMTLVALITAWRYNLPVKMIVFADRELNLIKLKQSWKGANFVGVGLYQGELFQEESILGVKILRAGDRGRLSTALKEALACPAPVIIEALIDPTEYGRLIEEP